jgi:uncharacterized membrane protein YgaE (UPF0421/DUF939 family)
MNITTLLELKRKYKMLSCLRIYFKRNKSDKNYTDLLRDVKQWVDATDKRLLEHNMTKMRKNHEELVVAEFGYIDKERKFLREDKKKWEAGKS